MLPWVNEQAPVFPPAEFALTDPNGLLAAGGNLNPNTLLDAYTSGLFPWFSEGEPILWWSPNPRCVIRPSEVHISRSLRKHIRKTKPCVTFDQDFESVIYHCSRTETSEDSWITQDMYEAYLEMHQAGHAHSIEVWQDNQLIGGLYGLDIGRVFFGESMFSLQTNASKVGFSALCRQLERWQFALIDCQVENPHLNSLGAHLIPRQQFLSILNTHCLEAPINTWVLDKDIFSDFGID